jgi:hypothetical protein
MIVLSLASESRFGYYTSEIESVNRNRVRIVTMTPVQCRMARVGLGLTVRQLAQLVPCSTETVGRFELGETLKPRTVDDLQRTLETAGAVFIDEDGVRIPRR